jgi:methyl-accepting chemotaxis protein
MSPFKLSVRLKIMGAVATVAAVVLLLGGFAARNALTETGGRGEPILRKHFLRYKGSFAELGTSEYAVARLIASDPTLARALEAGEAAQVIEVAKRFSEALAPTIAPDLFTISDATGTLFSGGGLRPVAGSDWRASRLFQDLREGKIVRGEFAIVAKKPYRVSGAAVRAEGAQGRIVGVVLIAQQLDSWFRDVAANSGSDKPEKQHRMALVSGDSVLASAVLKEDWNALSGGTKTLRDEPEGEAKVPVIDFNGKTWDVWKEPILGYDRGGDPDKTELGTLWMVRSREDQAAKIRAASSELALYLGISMVLALVVGYLLAVQITRPLKRYIVATEQLSRGQADLGKRLDVETNDELGLLARNLNRVFAKIHSLAAGVQRTAFQVNASSGEISTVSKRMLDGAKEQAGKITNSTAAVTELSSSIQQVAENAAEATRTAKQSGEAVSNAIARLGQIRSTVEDAASRIGALGESGKRIGNIVEVIRQISEQTTMLALNAAIEAAHAGEHGRGFAVVADEVSSLAKRTGQSARDIEDLIAAIRDQTAEAVRVMQDGSREVEEGTGLVEKTLADLKTLVSVIDDTASAVQEQAIASDEIARNMDAVQRIANQVLGASENAVSQGERLQQLAEELEHSVGGFKIDPERALDDEAELRALPEARS